MLEESVGPTPDYSNNKPLGEIQIKTKENFGDRRTRWIAKTEDGKLASFGFTKANAISNLTAKISEQLVKIDIDLFDIEEDLVKAVQVGFEEGPFGLGKGDRVAIRRLKQRLLYRNGLVFIDGIPSEESRERGICIQHPIRSSTFTLATE